MLVEEKLLFRISFLVPLILKISSDFRDRRWGGGHIIIVEDLAAVEEISVKGFEQVLDNQAIRYLSFDINSVACFCYLDRLLTLLCYFLLKFS